MYCLPMNNKKSHWVAVCRELWPPVLLEPTWCSNKTIGKLIGVVEGAGGSGHSKEDLKSH